MADPTLTEIMQALAAQIEGQLKGTASPVIPDLQITPLLNWNPSPPSIDIYPADPFQVAIAYGKGNNEMNFVVRVRTNTPDHDGAQELLLTMMDPTANESVANAILEDKTLGDKVEDTAVEGPSDFGVFIDPGQSGAFLGFTLLAKVTP